MIHKIERLVLPKLLERQIDRTNLFNLREELSFLIDHYVLAAFAVTIRLCKKKLRIRR